MNKNLLFLLLIPFLGFSQVQIGQDIDGEAAGVYSGSSTSLSADGSIIATGSLSGDNNKGLVRIYQNISGVWTKLGQDLKGKATGDGYGANVSLSADGTILAISASAAGNIATTSYVQVYKYITGNWTKIGQDITGARMGNVPKLSSDGSILAIGNSNTTGFSGNGHGSVRVFKNVSGTWTQIGQEIFGYNNADWNGFDVSISADGNILAMGAPVNHGIANTNQISYVRIFRNSSGAWTQIGQDIEGVLQDQSGRSVSLSADGATIAIGAMNFSSNGMINKGKVKVFQNISNNWTQIGQDIEGVANHDLCGYNVSLSANSKVLVVSSARNNQKGTFFSIVKIYENIGNTWVQKGNNILQEADGDAAHYISLSSNGKKLAIGAPYNDGNGLNSGHVRVYDLSGILSNNEFVSQNFNIYPNPTSDILNVSLENNLVLEQVTIYNNLGQVVKKATENVINVSQFSKGLYFVEVTTNQGKETKKVIVK